MKAKKETKGGGTQSSHASNEEDEEEGAGQLETEGHAHLVPHHHQVNMDNLKQDQLHLFKTVWWKWFFCLNDIKNEIWKEESKSVIAFKRQVGMCQSR